MTAQRVELTNQESIDPVIHQTRRLLNMVKELELEMELIENRKSVANSDVVSFSNRSTRLPE